MSIVSIIVPIYNVEPYLRKCVDSILAQSFTDIEILLIDDGSTDQSGDICDSYSDQRIRVFHTDNRGLSAARNLGIEEASGELISFVDSDDWIEQDFFARSLALIGYADVLCVGNDIQSSYPIASYTGYEAMVALLDGRISNAAWCKIYKKECFASIRFPEGRIHEDTATTYKIFLQSHEIKCSFVNGYHYRQRDNSISNIHNMKNIIDFWLANKERYDYCKDIVSGEAYEKLLQTCAYAISRAWAWKNLNTKEIEPIFSEMSSFAKSSFPRHIYLKFPLRDRVGVFLGRHPTKFSFWLANRFLVVLKNLQRKPVK